MAKLLVRRIENRQVRNLYALLYFGTVCPAANVRTAIEMKRAACWNRTDATGKHFRVSDNLLHFSMETLQDWKSPMPSRLVNDGKHWRYAK